MSTAATRFTRAGRVVGNARARQRPRVGSPSRREAGTTLVEMVVTLAVFALLLAMVAPMFVALQTAAATAQSIDVSANELRPVLQTLAIQVGSAAAIPAVQTGVLTIPTDAYGNPGCAQWKVVPGTTTPPVPATLQERFWTPSTTTAVPFQVEATGIVDPASQPPFTVASSVLTVIFYVKEGRSGGVSQVRTSDAAPTLASTPSWTGCSPSPSKAS